MTVTVHSVYSLSVQARNRAHVAKMEAVYQYVTVSIEGIAVSFGYEAGGICGFSVFKYDY